MEQSSQQSGLHWIGARPARPDDEPAIRKLVHDVLAEYGMVVDQSGDDRDLDDISAFYAGQGGSFDVLVDAEGRIVGTVGLLAHSSDVCELRKMYFLPELRGRGWGKLILDRMIRAAQARRFQRMNLKTASTFLQATALYRQFGFQPATPGEAPRCDLAFTLRLAAYRPPLLPKMTLHEAGHE